MLKDAGGRPGLCRHFGHRERAPSIGGVAYQRGRVGPGMAMCREPLSRDEAGRRDTVDDTVAVVHVGGKQLAAASDATEMTPVR